MNFQICEVSRNAENNTFDVKKPEAFIKINQIQNNDEIKQTIEGSRRIKTFSGLTTQNIRLGDIISSKNSFYRIIKVKKTQLATLIKAEQVI